MKRFLLFMLFIILCVCAIQYSFADDVIILPGSLTRIESESFAGIHVDTIIFNENIKFIDDHAFDGATFTGTGYPGIYAQEWCSNHGFDYVPYMTPEEDFEWETINCIEAKITKYNGDDPIVIIPEMLDDYDIVEISNDAFKGNTSLTTVFFPNVLRTIDSHAFQNCPVLHEIIFNEGLINIGAEAFRNCPNILFANLPDSLEGLGEGAFRECSSLTGFHYPASLCHRNSLYDNGYLYDGNIFRDCDSFTSFEVPEGTTILCEGLFYGANKLESVTLPSTLKEIGDNAFHGCVSLGAIEFPDGLVTIHEDAFHSCPLIESILLPNSLIRIEAHAFIDCTSLESIVFSDQLKDIDAGAFWNCSSLTAANLPDSLEGLGESAFGECVNLESIHYPLSLDHRNSEYGNGYLYDGKTFYNCKKLRSVTIPEGVTKIADGIFMRANYLREINLPSTLTTIEAHAFAYCESVRNITIPESVSTIGNEAFLACTALRSITLPNNVVSIGLGCFRSCTYLSSVDFSTQLKSIGAGAFEDCTALTAANLPDSLEGLGEKAFYGCTKLNTFHYPLHLDHLNSIYENGNIYEGNIFHDCIALKTIEIPSGVTTIPGAVFAGSNYLETVIVPDTVTTIGGKGTWWSNGETFKDCIAMEKIYIGPNVTTVYDDTFAGCTNITVWCEYGSAVLQHCIDNNVPYYYLTPDGVNSPSGTLYQGDTYNFHGYARASIALTEVTATIWNSNKSEVMQTITVEPDVTDYDLSGQVNQHLKFSQLPLGQYCFSLVASTELSDETWADNTFRIAEPPLRVSISSFSFPTVLAENADGPGNLTGEVYSNYTMTSLKVQIVNKDGTSFFSQNYSPSAKQYSLSNVSLAGLQLPAGNYSLRIYVTAKGETKKVKDYSFGLAGEAVVASINEDTRGEIENYVLNHSAGTFYVSSLVKQYIQNNKGKMTIFMAGTDYLDISLDLLEDFIGAKDYSSYMVKRYEKEMASLIKDLNYNGSTAYQQFSAFGQAKEFANGIKNIYKVQGSYDKITLAKFSQELDTLIKNGNLSDNELLKTAYDMKEASSEIGSLFKTVGYTETGINMICSLFEDHGADLAMLDYIEEYYDVSSNPEMRQALKNLRTQYSKEYGTALNTLFDQIKSKIRDEGIELITEAVLGPVVGANLKLVDTCLKLILKYSGATEIADNYWTLLVRSDAVNTMSKGFENLCSEYKASVQSGHALTTKQGAALLTAFTNARLALVRLYEIMEEVDSDHASEYQSLKQQALGRYMPGAQLMTNTSLGGGGGAFGGGGSGSR